jgi:hypothetical protein
MRRCRRADSISHFIPLFKPVINSFNNLFRECLEYDFGCRFHYLKGIEKPTSGENVVLIKVSAATIHIEDVRIRKPIGMLWTITCLRRKGVSAATMPRPWP